MRNTTSLMEQQASLSDQNVHISSTKRVLNGSDDPVAIATIQRLKQELSVGEQYITNGETAQSANELSDTVLSQSTYILQRVRELIVSGSNGTNSEASREAIAVELEGLKEELMGIANTQDGNGQYIYAGYEVNTQPFQLNEFGEVDYEGDSGERKIAIGSGVTVKANDAGDKVFMNVAEGNGTFVSEVGSTNNGSGVISAGSVVNENLARDYLDQDYTIAITGTDDDPEYSVYGLKGSAVTGSASITVNSVDSSASVDLDSSKTIKFVETGTNTFNVGVEVAGVFTAYGTYNVLDNNTTTTLDINGVSVDIKGKPADGDTYTLSQFVEATPYKDDQAISFNGIKTTIKGAVDSGDAFTLRQSEEKDMFSMIQSAIDTLRITGTDEASNAERSTGFSMSLLQIDNAIDNIISTQTSVGARLNTIDNQYDSLLDFNLTTQTNLSSLEDLDMAAAISDYQQQYSMLEVSQQTFVQLQQLTLFSLI